MSKYFLVFCFLICSASNLYADIAVLEPVADSPLFAYHPDNNYGMLLKKNPESGNLPRCYPYMRESVYQPVQLIVEYIPTALERRTFGQIKALFQ
jgi:hypothetical protein